MANRAERPRTLGESLRGWSHEQLVTLLRLRPDLTYPLPGDFTELANRATTITSTARALDGLDAWQLVVTEGLATLPDPVSLDELSVAVGGPPPSVAEAVAQLRRAALVWGDEAALHLVRTVREAFEPYPGGLAPPSAHPLSDDEVQAALRTCTPQMLQVLDRLRFAPAGAVRHADRPVSAESARTPVEALLARRLLRPLDAETVLLPREVAWRLRDGRLRADPVRSQVPALTGPAKSKSLVDRAATGAAFSLLTDVELLIHALEERPHRPLRTGGLGARDLSALARTLGVDEPQAVFVVECAAAADLIAPGSSHGLLPTGGFDAWVSQDAGRRWWTLAQAWLAAPRWFARAAWPGAHALGPEAAAPAAPALRRAVLAHARSAGAGVVLEPDQLGAGLAWLRPRLSRSEAAAIDLAHQTWREAGWLGLSALGAGSAFLPALLDGAGLPSELADAFPEPVQTLVFQADLTAVAPGPLRHDVSAELRLLADQESRGAGGVYRFSPASLRRAFDAGWSSPAVLDWLTGHASTELPQPLRYLVADVARRHGSVRVGPIGSLVRADDDTQLAGLLSDPRAESLGIRRLTPGVVVAAAEPEELVALLRELGLSPVAEDERGHDLARPPLSRAPAVSLSSPSAPLGPERAASALRAAHERAAIGSSTAAAIATALDDLRSATRDGVPVQLTWVGADGRSTVRELAPLDLSAGLVRAVDRTSAEVVTVALSRIAAVSRVPSGG